MKKYPKEKIYNKLVRDRIPEIIEQDGIIAETKILSNDEFLSSLKKKILEEGKEFVEAVEEIEVKKEMADILEILYSFAEERVISLDEVESIRKERAEKRGRFKERIFLIGTKEKN